ncbi:S-adenosyl-L-methionine-dependent methyltransferase [Lanmaoa asiatica]|nr:S-adenosyl-L-methionine-dependent methyltransferase [Lanmaoa asiatica]
MSTADVQPFAARNEGSVRPRSPASRRRAITTPSKTAGISATPTNSPTFTKADLKARFGEEPVVKMVDWASTHVPPTACPNILDVGMGNGHLLFALVEAGYDASRLTGIDYSQGSVDLSTAIAKQRDEDGDNEDHTCKNITFAVCDFLDPESSIPPPGRESTSDGVWDLILDKGTYDAISLMDKDERGIVPLESYVPRVIKLLRPGGRFLITSCNFTEDELTQKIATQGSSFEYKWVQP